MSQELPFISHVLRIVQDYDSLLASGFSPAAAIETMRGGDGRYDPMLFSSLEAEAMCVDEDFIVRTVPVIELPIGAVLAEDIFDIHGIKMISKGYEITEVLRMRLVNFASYETISPVVKIIALVDQTSSG